MLRLIRIIGDRNAGFVLGMVVVANLAAGSLVMDRFPKLYPPFFPNEFGFFFDPVRMEHVWFYVLLVTFTLFTVNLFACTVDTVVGMVRNGGARMRPIAALLFHLALLLILVAHLHDGLYGESQRVVLDRDETELAGIGTVRVEAVRNFHHPDGALKETEADLHFRLEDGREIERTIAYNQPALFDWATREVLIQQGTNEPAGVVAVRGSDGAEIRFMPFDSHRVGAGHLILRGIVMTGMGVPAAEFIFMDAEGRFQPHFMLLDERASRHSRIEVAGEIYGYRETAMAPFALVVVRYNPAIPTVMVGLLLTSAGTIMLLWWMRTARRRASGGERRE